MQAADGAFSTPTENVYLDIPLATVRQMTDGNHTLYVRGKDAAGSWGDPASTVLKVDKTGPAITGLTLTPNPTNGAGTVTLTASVTDPLSSVVSAEWFLGADPGVGNGTALSTGPGGTGGPVSATVTVATLPEGNVPVTVRAKDALGNTSTAVVQLQVRHPLWFSTSGNTNPPGVTGTADDSDVYGWSGTAFSRTLDLSAPPYAVPVAANVDGFSRVSATSFYVSFTDAVTLPGARDRAGRGRGALERVALVAVLRRQRARRRRTPTSTRSASWAASCTSPRTPTPTPRGSAARLTTPTSTGGTAGPATPGCVDATGVGIPASANADGFVWRSATDYLFSFSADTTVTDAGRRPGRGRRAPHRHHVVRLRRRHRPRPDRPPPGRRRVRHPVTRTGAGTPPAPVREEHHSDDHATA